MSRALEADQAQVVQRRHAGVLDEQPQQVAFRRIADRRECRHVPIAVGPGDDGILHTVHRCVQMSAMHVKGRQLGIARRASQVHH
ncbi:MAG TPA: hypothetical protein VLD86_05975, partial [Ilumatobacteraceae bacterium]|nr:hypothetical protein [Ilumatobacteraceae bacterium]